MPLCHIKDVPSRKEISGTNLPEVCNIWIILRNFANANEKMDLSIAKCHFEIGAGKEHFEWA
jgi:hypothetical protein